MRERYGLPVEGVILNREFKVGVLRTKADGVRERDRLIMSRGRGHRRESIKIWDKGHR